MTSGWFEISCGRRMIESLKRGRSAFSSISASGDSEKEVAEAQAMQTAAPGAVQVTTNPGKGTVRVSEPSQVIGAAGDTTKGAAPNGNAPAVRGSKLPTAQALHVNPIHPDELAAVGAMHRKMKGSTNGR